ncbi:MAG TPA: HD domain-containing phosphohydrolase [Nitrospiria bacterium]|nr:HD domain-containing phosphohydrolase [Nitrospiria bacterium]
MTAPLLKIPDLIHAERLRKFIDRSTDACRGSVSILDANGQPVPAEGSPPPAELRGDPDFVRQVLNEKNEDRILRHSRFPLYAAPLLCQGACVGLLLIRFPTDSDDPTVRARQERDFRPIRDHLRDLLDTGYELLNLSSEIVRNYEELSLLYDLSLKLSAQSDPERIGRIVADEVQSVLPAQNLSILMVDAQTGALDSRIAIGRDGRRHPPYRIEPGRGIAGRVVRTGQPLIVCDVGQDPGFVPVSYPITSLMSVPMMLGRKTLGTIDISDKLDGKEFSTYDLKLIQAIAAEAAVALENARLFAEVKDLFLSTVKSLVMAIDAKDPYTHLHSLRVSEVSAILSDELGLPPPDVEQIKLAALLHDVGKIGVPEKVLLKPGKLSPAEWAEIKRHPLHSVHILEQVKQFSHILQWVRHEHEHYDGSGYPDGLVGGAIPLPSRIIAVADAFDAITSDRYYRKGSPEDAAVEIIQKEAGIQFDPEVIRAFVSAHRKGRFGGLPT